jgi:hypothetical protein
MKRSHKKLRQQLNDGYWLKSNAYSYKTRLLMKDLNFVGIVRQSTIDEMMKLGLLKIVVKGSSTAYIPT